MSIMHSWLLSIAGVVVVGVLVDLLLTDSHMSKFIRAIYGFFILFVIVSPIPNLIRGGVNLSNLDPDDELMGHINAQSLVAAQHRLDRAMNTAGFSHVLTTILPVLGNVSFQIDRDFVTGGGIDNRARIIQIVTATLNVDEGRIIYA